MQARVRWPWPKAAVAADASENDAALITDEVAATFAVKRLCTLTTTLTRVL